MRIIAWSILASSVMIADALMTVEYRQTTAVPMAIIFVGSIAMMIYFNFAGTQ